MDSPASISTVALRLMPLVGLLRHDLRTLASSWLVRLWLLGSILVTLLLVAAGWPHQKTAELATSLLMPYLVGPWFLVVVVLGADPVSSARMDALADGILSRPVTRYEYLLASWAARLLVVLGCYLVVVVPAVVWVSLADRKAAAESVTLYGSVASVAVVGLVLTFLVSFAYLLGTLFRRPLLAVVVSLFVWFPSNLVLSTFSLEAFSTLSLSQSLPSLFRTPWRLDSASEIPADVNLGQLAESTAQLFSIFGGGVQQPEKPKSFFDQDPENEFSLLHVCLGYGLTTLGCLAVTLLAFCTRDL